MEVYLNSNGNGGVSSDNPESMEGKEYGEQSQESRHAREKNSDNSIVADLRRLSHDLKNALHGAALNLEVAKMRIESEKKPSEVDLNSVLPFLHTAAEQVDSAAKLHDEYSAIAMSFVQTTRSR